MPAKPFPPGDAVTRPAAITPRNLRFAFPAQESRPWCGGDPIRTAFFDGMSLMFPDGERMFIESVRDTADGITDPALLADIRNFTIQEGMHSREHSRFNDRVAAGAPALVARLQAGVARRVALVGRYLKPEQRLAATVAAEHFTAVLADYILRRPDLLADADPELARLWLWHAIEETEHKGVAFDVLASRRRGLGGWWLRARTMLLLTVSFSFFLSLHVILLARVQAGGRLGFRQWGRLIAFFWAPAGVIPGTLRAWLAFFRPGFHPWDHDNRPLIEARRRELQLA